MGNILSKLFNPSADAELQHLKSALDEAKKKGDKTKSKRIMNKIVHIQLYRFHNTIDLWKQGILNFEDVTYPTNEDLITVYNDAVLDAHLTALIESRKKKTTGAEFKIVDDKGDEITDQSEKLSGQWFTDAISHALDSIYYGFSLLQFGDKVGEGFASVSVVPREFVYPQKQIVRNSPTSDDGIPWSKFAAWLVPAGRADDMGLLSKATPLTIYKKAALGSWADYTDLFGTPLRVGKTDVRDEKTRDNMFEMMEAMVSSTFAVIDKEDEVEFVQSKNSDAYETFNQQIERLNSEMSKLILGSTMTMDDGSSRSQSEVHENTTNQLAKSDSVMITNWVNHVFIPWLNVYHGFGITGKFTFDTTEVLTLEDQFERDIKLINTGAYNVPAKYITETYGIPVEEIEIETDPDPKGGGKPEDTENKLPGKFEGETQGFERFAYEIDAMYKSICCEAGEDVDPPLSDDQMEQLYRDIFNGKVTPDDLPVDLYGATGELLVDGVVEGLNNYQKLGLGYVPDQVFFNALSDNAFKFAGAKTFQQTRDMSDALVDENGNQRTWNKFRKEVDKINNQYNKNWLKAEYNNATGGSQMASQWQDIEEDADIFPYLQYKTAGDKRVRQDHRPLNDVIRPIKDSFWKTFYPPNGWNCRCDVIKLTEEAAGKVTDLSKIKEPEMPDEFKINMGEKRVIYSPEHPYFIISDQYKPAVDALVIPKPRKLEIEKPKETEVVSLGVGNFKPGTTHGKLKGNALEMQKQLESFTGFKVPDELIGGLKQEGRFFDNLLHFTPDIFKAYSKRQRAAKRKVPKGAFYQPNYGQVQLKVNSARWKKGGKYRESVTAHELGHAFHMENGIITYEKTDPKLKEFKSVFMKELKKHKDLAVYNEELKRRDIAAFYKGEDYDKKYKPKERQVFNYEREQLGAFADTLEAVTAGEYGFGHGKEYMQTKNMADMEIFAHIFENHFVGNEFFKKEMPISYEWTLKYAKDILKKYVK